MPKKPAKQKAEPAKGSGAMRTLIVDNGSQYVGKIKQHVEDEAKEQGIDHKVATITVEQLKEAYDSNNTDIFRGVNYVISSGSPKRRKYDTELHAFIESNLDANAVFLGVCHGAQQYAQAHGATVENTRHMHRGERSKNKKWARKPYSS
jgi:GMP synthase-like glutamine amidotransferase|tara:strand:- start:5407 stop:5853 length:447 start_codon:yes stop_codon:yes gene_type:complete